MGMINVAAEITEAPEMAALPDGSRVELHLETKGSTIDLLIPWATLNRIVTRGAVLLAERDAAPGELSD